MKSNIKSKMYAIIDFLEIVLAIIVGIAVIMGTPDLFKYIVDILNNSAGVSYIYFGSFLKHVLLLIVGLELMLMIISHSHEAVLPLVLFVIARKMLVYSDGMLDILIGTISIAIIFFVIRFVIKENDKIAREENIFQAKISLEEINNVYGISLPVQMGDNLEELIEHLSKVEGIDKIKRGIKLTYGDYSFTVTSASKGKAERVKIKNISSN